MSPLAVPLSLLVGLSLGMLGGGGSILTVPMLVYALGVPPGEAIATSLVVVGVTSAAGAVQRARAGEVEWRTGGLLGAAGMVGAVAGARAAAGFTERTLLVLFAAVMVATAVAMLRGRREVEPPPAPAPAWRTAVHGLGLGGLTGLVGAGGGFLVVPALVVLGGLPMRRAVGTSLLVIALNCAAGLAGRIGSVHVSQGLTMIVTGSAVLGALAGGWLGGRVSPVTLRRAFGGLVLVLGLAQLWREL